MALTIRRRNFSGQTEPPKADVYEECNFAQPAPVDVLRTKRGVRLWPGDDTPRVFVRCNLKNCEPPPGSKTTECCQSLSVIEKVDETEKVVVKLMVEDDRVYKPGMYTEYTRRITVYGRRVDGKYEDNAVPEVIEDAYSEKVV